VGLLERRHIWSAPCDESKQRSERRRKHGFKETGLGRRTYQVSYENFVPERVEEMGMTDSVRTVGRGWEDDSLCGLLVEFGERVLFGRNEACIAAVILYRRGRVSATCQGTRNWG
jgi:hypothetical protein